MPALNALYERYRDRASFHVIYITEAHASDLWQMPSNVRDKVLVPSAHTFDERCQAAGMCAIGLALRFPALVDTMDNATETAYTAWPDRLYVVDKDGRVAFKSRPGPFGFDTKGVEETLARLCGA